MLYNLIRACSEKVSRACDFLYMDIKIHNKLTMSKIALKFDADNKTILPEPDSGCQFPVVVQSSINYTGKNPKMQY